MDYTLTFYILAMLANMVCGFLAIVMAYFAYDNYLDSRDTDFSLSSRDTYRSNARVTGAICLLSIGAMVIGNLLLAKWWATTFANPEIITITNATMVSVAFALGVALFIWIIKKVVED